MEVRFLGRPERDPWVGVNRDTDPNWEFRTTADLRPEELRQRYREACDRSPQFLSDATSLDQQSVNCNLDHVHTLVCMMDADRRRPLNRCGESV